MAVTAPQFKLFFPEFTAVDDARVNLFLGLSEAQVGENWGKFRDTATLYLTAHLLTLASRGGNGASGPVTSERLGDVSRSYAAPVGMGATSSPLTSSTYGSEYARLARLCIVSPLVL